MAMALCRLTGVGPSLLLHPLDFLGGDDEPDIAFFPGMRMPAAAKVAFVRDVLADFSRLYEVVPMGEHAAVFAIQNDLPVRRFQGDMQEPARALTAEVEVMSS